MVFSSHEHVSSVTEFWRTQLNSTNNYIRITNNDVLLRCTFIQHLLCSKHTVPPRPPSPRIHTNSYWTMVKANISWNHWRKNQSYNTEVIFQYLLLVIWDTFQIRYFYWCNLHDVLFKNYLFVRILRQWIETQRKKLFPYVVFCKSTRFGDRCSELVVHNCHLFLCDVRQTTQPLVLRFLIFQMKMCNLPHRVTVKSHCEHTC